MKPLTNVIFDINYYTARARRVLPDLSPPVVGRLSLRRGRRRPRHRLPHALPPQTPSQGRQNSEQNGHNHLEIFFCQFCEMGEVKFYCLSMEVITCTLVQGQFCLKSVCSCVKSLVENQSGGPNYIECPKCNTASDPSTTHFNTDRILLTFVTIYPVASSSVFLYSMNGHCYRFPVQSGATCPRQGPWRTAWCPRACPASRTTTPSRSRTTSRTASR